MLYRFSPGTFRIFHSINTLLDIYVVTGSKNKETRSKVGEFCSKFDMTGQASIKLVKNIEKTSQKSRQTGKEFKLSEEFDETGSKIN